MSTSRVGAKGRLPTFFVIGASKAGTTALYRYLDLHPQVTMTQPKEPHVMLGPDYRTRAAQYEEMFSADRPVRGEASTGYSVYPHNPEVSGNIADLVPDARLIYMVRDPVERTIAHYAQATMVGRELRPIEQAIRAREPDNYYVCASRYWRQLEAYLDHFPGESILVIDSECLRSDRLRTLQRIYSHIGADADFNSRALWRQHNVRGVDNVAMPALGRRLRRGRTAHLYRAALPVAARRYLSPRLGRLLGGRDVRPVPDAELLEVLADELASDAERLRAFTGERFASWSV